MTGRTIFVLLPLVLSGCGALAQLSNVGRPPPMTPTENPNL
ncbi:MAG: hypothetical protein ACREFJ_17335 [Acetobacteraceae bacterium]